MRSQVLHTSRQLFLAAAGLSFVGSVFSWFLVDREVGLFIGLWVPSILSLGTLLQLHFREGGQ
jgi:hypothetical protein